MSISCIFAKLSLVWFGLVWFGWELQHIQACPELGPVAVPACFFFMTLYFPHGKSTLTLFSSNPNHPYHSHQMETKKHEKDIYPCLPSLGLEWLPISSACETLQASKLCHRSSVLTVAKHHCLVKRLHNVHSMILL